MAARSHVVVVDDELKLREAVGEYLELHGFRISLAEGGAGLRRVLAGQVPVDLVILDLNMPGEDGLTLARFLREHSPAGILILTAAGDVVDRIVGLEIGADDYMAKPFDLRELLARVKSVLRRVSSRPVPGDTAPRQGRIRLGKLVLDATARTLSDEAGDGVPLTAAELDLLLVLAGSPNRVLSRDQLLEMTHGHGADPFDRSIDVRITRLRRKIEDDPARPRYIKTVRGAGYMFIPDQAR